MTRNKHLFESGVYLTTDSIVDSGIGLSRAAISRLAGVALATFLAGCASPALNRIPLVARSNGEPPAIAVAENGNSPATTIVAYRPVAVEAAANEPTSPQPVAAEYCPESDPFEDQPVAADKDRAAARRLLGLTLFRDPGLSAPFAIRSTWEDVPPAESNENSGSQAAPPLLLPSEMLADSPRSARPNASKRQRFERALVSSNDAWCRFRLSPLRRDQVLVARANGYDEQLEFWEDGGYSRPDPCADCGERQCECDDGNGCGVAIEGDGACCGPRRLSFRQDMYDAIRIGKADFVDLLTVQNGVILGVAGGAAAIIHRNVDPQVRDWTAEHPDRWGHATNFLGDLGNPWVQGGLLTGVYAYGLWQQDEEIHELSLALVGAWKIAAVGTVGLKYIVHTDRPSDGHIHSVWEGGQYGFPSIEASTSFAMAAVFDSFYGLKAGIPAYMLAGLISWSRIDTRDSDVSDVVFGAVFGYVIGKSVAIHHIENAYGFKLQPYMHPTSGAPGVALQFAF